MKNKSNTNTLKTFAFDYSAKLYPIIASKNFQSLYCVGAIMNEPVDPYILKTAVNDIMQRFPTIAVSIKKGYKCHYLQENTNEVKIFKSDDHVVKIIDEKETDGYMFRVSYKGKELKIDMFHGITDGKGALMFLDALICHYQRLRGVIFQDTGGILQLKDNPSDDEIGDSVLKYNKLISMNSLAIKTLSGIVPMVIKGTPVGESGNINIEGSVSLQTVKIKARESGFTITAYLAGIVANTLSSMSKSKKPIVLMIPVNLRNIFPSTTMRNFVTFVRIILKPAQCKNLFDCSTEISKQLIAKSTKAKMQKFINTTVQLQKLLPYAMSPLWVKKFVINTGRFFMGPRQTMIFSNIGAFSSPEEMGIDRHFVHMNVSAMNPQNMGVISENGFLRFNITRVIKEDTFSRTFFKTLEDLGIAVTEWCN